MNSIPDTLTADAPARVKIERTGKGTTLSFVGVLDVVGTTPLWNRVQHAASNVASNAAASTISALTIDLSGVTSCDTAGAAMLLQAERSHPGPVTFRGAAEAVDTMLSRIRRAALLPQPSPPAPPPGWHAVLQDTLDAAADGFVTLGEVVTAVIRLPKRARMFRLNDLLRAADEAGVQAIPLVALLGILIGLILAFQSLVPMRRFGADIYVANLVALGLVRELGPLLTAVLLAGRSGSAFASEIGTMKVNEELDALSTMGVDRITMLVLPRLLAAVLVMPVLTALMELSGLLGMTLVLTGSGIAPVTVMHQVALAVMPFDGLGGLLKAVLFGAVVALIGCRAGLVTGVGPRAVGRSATTAVVSGILATIALDGLLALLFYRFGI